MAEGDKFNEDVTAASASGFNPSLTVFLVVTGVLVAFIAVNVGLYMYAQKVMPPRKKKPISKKKLKKQKLKQGVAPAGE
eukprot:jgi/Mesen1/348/ME000001S02656